MRELDAVVVGGGVGGLSAMFELRDLAAAGRAVLLEERPRLGGNIITERVGGYVLDGGPDSWVAAKPDALALCRELAIDGEVMGTLGSRRKVYVLSQGALEAMPEGLVLGVPTDASAIEAAKLLSWAGRARALAEPLVPRRELGPDDDESVTDFLTRRLGQELTERLAAPLIAGIYAGDADALGIRAAAPQLVELEAKHGSLVVGMAKAMAARKQAQGSGAPASAFLSLQGGLAGLIDALAARIAPAAIHTSCSVRSVGPSAGAGRSWDVTLGDGEVLRARHVVLTAPAHALAALVASADESLAQRLAAVEYASAATVFLAFDAHAVPRALDAVGFIVPHVEGRPILAGTFVSSKWSHRAPDGKVLVRLFFGGVRGSAQLARTDEELVALAREELAFVLGVDRAAEPELVRVFRFQQTSIQPNVGHLTRMREIRALASRHEGLHVAFAGFEGSGIPDTVKQGRAAGRAIAAALSPG